MPPDLPFLHIVIAGDPPVGSRARATLMPLLSADAMLARARAARKVSDLFGLFRPRIHPTHAYDKWIKATNGIFRVERRAALGSRPVADHGEPIEIFLLAVFALPLGKWRKRSPIDRAWQTSHQAGDFDNLAKPVLDAANDSLWPDDSQVARACVEKVVGAQGEAPRIELLARRLSGSPHQTLFSAAASGRAWCPSSGSALED